MATIVGYLAGDFDLFHVGHLDDLRQAGQICDRLVVGVLSDEAVEAELGRQPFIPMVDRLAIVTSMRQVDSAVIESGASWQASWEIQRFDVLIIGAASSVNISWPAEEIVAAGHQVSRLERLRFTASEAVENALATRALGQVHQ